MDLRLLSALGLLGLATPAHAWVGAQIPEPSNLALFGLGLAGLIIGRFMARSRSKHDEGGHDED